MNTHSVFFLTAVAVFLVVLISIAAYSYFRGRRSSQVGWEGLLEKLALVDRNSIAQVALDLVDESGQPRKIVDKEGMEASEIWKLTGGLEGLEVLERNSEVLIDLAAYLQQWYPEALVVAERLRLDARELKWHVARLKGAARTGNLEISFPFYAQRAVVAYYIMTRRVLALYEAGNFPMFRELQKTL